MLETFVVIITFGLLWLAVSRSSRWKERAQNAQESNKATRKAHTIKNRITIDDDERQRVRDHFDAS